MKKHKVIIIGAGISGLCVAYRLGKKTDFIILEKSRRVGGRIHSERHGAILTEHGPNAIMLRSPIVKDLLQDLGLNKRLLYPGKNSKRRFICDDGRLIQVTPLSVFFTNLTDMCARLQLVLGGISRRSSHINETVTDFFSRKISSTFVKNLITPLMSGIFAGDPDDLIMRSAFPKIYAWDKVYNSLILGALRTEIRKHTIPSGMCSFPNGLQELPEFLAQEVQERLFFDQAVQSVKRHNDGFLLETAEEQFFCEKLVVTMAAPEFAAVLQGYNELKDLLNAVYYPWMRVCHFVYDADDIGDKRRGFGFLNTHHKKVDSLGCLFSSHMFSGRAAVDEELYTVFCGGAKGRHTKNIPLEELAKKAHFEVARALKIRAEQPKYSYFAEWPLSIPQYNLAHLPLLEKISSREHEKQGLYFSSNYAYGISVSDCIERAHTVAERLLS